MITLKIPLIAEFISIIRPIQLPMTIPWNLFATVVGALVVGGGVVVRVAAFEVGIMGGEVVVFFDWHPPAATMAVTTDARKMTRITTRKRRSLINWLSPADYLQK
jgi:hypothetical protein